MEDRDFEVKEHIQNALLFCANELTHCDIQELSDKDFSLIEQRIIPSFCYDNAFMAAVTLNGHAIVYGAALINFDGKILPIEHAWIKMGDGTYADPTYQCLTKNTEPLDTKYYALLEVPTSEYVDLAKSLGNNLGHIVAMDFMWIRRSAKHKHLFSTSRKRCPEPH